jgi:predicted Co/Zn/Cd cation transporter (cation efflux family)
MNITPFVEDLNEADWTLADIADMTPDELTEHVDSLVWERMHYESILREFGPETRQGRYAQTQIDVIDVIVGRLEAARVPRPVPAVPEMGQSEEVSYHYAQAS